MRDIYQRFYKIIREPERYRKTYRHCKTLKKTREERQKETYGVNKIEHGREKKREC